jgi:hypothetical protein
LGKISLNHRTLNNQPGGKKEHENDVEYRVQYGEPYFK